MTELAAPGRPSIRRWLVISGLAVGLALAAPTLVRLEAPPTPRAVSGLDGTLVARVGETAITRAAWESRVGVASAGDARRMLAAETRRLAVLAAAREAGFADRPEVRERMEEAMIALFLAERLDERLADVRLTREDMAAISEAGAMVPAPLRRMAIIRRDLDETDDPTAVRDELARTRDEVAALQLRIAHFGPLAQRLSDDRATRSRGGVVGYLPAAHREHDRVPAAVHAALWALEAPGAISDPIRVGSSLYLVRFVDERMPAGADRQVIEDGERNRRLGQRRAEVRERFLRNLEIEAGVEIADDWRWTPPPARVPEPPATPVAGAPKRGTEERS